MTKDNYLLATDYDENGNHYYFIYNWQTLEILKKFNDLESAQGYFDAIPN